MSGGRLNVWTSGRLARSRRSAAAGRRRRRDRQRCRRVPHVGGERLGRRLPGRRRGRDPDAPTTVRPSSNPGQAERRRPRRRRRCVRQRPRQRRRAPTGADACPTVYALTADGVRRRLRPRTATATRLADAADACPTESAHTRNGCPLPALTGLSGKVDQARVAAVRDRAGEHDPGCDGADPRAAQEGHEVGQGEEADARHERQPRQAHRAPPASAAGIGSSWPSTATPARARRRPGTSASGRHPRVSACRLGVLAFGDSITNGGGELQWGVALQSWALWVARGLGLPYTPHAQDGATVQDVLASADPAGPDRHAVRPRLPVRRRQRRAHPRAGTATRSSATTGPRSRSSPSAASAC